MTDLEYAKALEQAIENHEDREKLLDTVDYLKHRYIVEREDAIARAELNRKIYG